MYYKFYTFVLKFLKSPINRGLNHQMGEEGLSHGMTKENLKRIKELEKENGLLKEIIAEKELEFKMQQELLKKKFALEKKRR
jgi:putative transposase